MVGTARKKLNSAAYLRVRPCVMPPMMVAAERETPGTMARHWNTPMVKAWWKLMGLSVLVRSTRAPSGR